MPKGPCVETRPADDFGLAVMIGKIANMQTLGMLGLLCISLSACGESQQQPQNGRYRIHATDQGAVLLDSATGKTWLQVYAEDRRDKAAYWEPSARIDDRDEWKAYDTLHPPETKNSN